MKKYLAQARRFEFKFALIAILGASALASADQITGNLTVDDGFTAYLSTSDSTAGTVIGTGNFWGTTWSLTPTILTPGQTYYLHIDASNGSGAAGFIGDFSLSGTDFEFANGSQNLLTETTDWLVSDSGFGSGYYTPTDEGANGVSPWGTRPGISGSADWLWGSSVQDGQHEYFSTEITPLTSSVPTPAAFPAASLLLVGLGYIRLKQKHD